MSKVENQISNTIKILDKLRMRVDILKENIYDSNKIVKISWTDTRGNKLFYLQRKDWLEFRPPIMDDCIITKWEKDYRYDFFNIVSEEADG